MTNVLHRSAAFILFIAFSACALAQTSSVTLRDGLNNYSGTADADSAQSWGDSSRGTERLFNMNWNTSAAFIRFAIFQSEGGPVPDGATITSATLSIYQYDGATSTWEVRRVLKNWKEMEVSWIKAAVGLPWQTGGAQGASDVASAADAQTAMTVIPGWLSFNVTAGVQAFAAGTPNYGWRLGWVGGTTGAKNFHSSDTTDPANLGLRPTLAVSYTPPPAVACGSGELRPYSGSPIQINSTGTTSFEAEHFNCGGQGVAYHDTTPGPNAGQTFRGDESVDIIGAPGGMAVNNFDAGEWMIYTINVQTAGTYDIGILTSAAASGGTNRAFRVEINGTDVTGPVDVPATNDWNDYQSVEKLRAVHLNPGQYQLKLVSVGHYFRVDKIQLAPSISEPAGCNAPPSRPYDQLSPQPITISATGTTTFEAEHFNCGGQGYAYNELPGNNNPGQTFRTGEAVDVIDLTPSGRAVNELETGEWLEYTLSIPAGTYQVGVLAASGWAGTPQVRFELNGQPVGTANVSTGSFGAYVWFNVGTVTVPAGTGHKLRLVSEMEHFRVDKIRFIAPLPDEGDGGDGGTGGGGGTTSDPCHASAFWCALFEGLITGTDNWRFETDNGKGGRIEWWAGNKAEDDPAPNNKPVFDRRRIALVPGGRDGNSAIKLTTLEMDDCVEVSCPTQTNERSEIRLHVDGSTSGGRPAAGQSTAPGYWLAHSVYFPQEFAIHANDFMDSIFLQFHNGGGPPAFALNVYNQPGTHTKVLRAYGFNTSGNASWSYVPPGAGVQKGQCLLDNVEEEVWYDFVHYIVWSRNGNGEHHVWLRKGPTGSVTKVLERTGVTNLFQPNANGFGGTAYLKLGTYHWPVTSTTSFPGERLKKENGQYLAPKVPGVESVIHDRVRRGPTFESVAPPGFTQPAWSFPAGQLPCGATTP